MEEDLSTKAPVTRLRRKLSVEQTEESKSPALSTPTKKRGARAAKPQLELIEENVTVAEKITPRRATRRSIARDTVEEEKPLTPSRRSTRIRSNTSLVLETTQVTESPRTKRATRRTSLAGSDTEAPITPARTRKTRKDSASVDKPGDTTIITEAIIEEPEINISQSKVKTPETSRESNISPNSLRKSTRLLAKQSPVISSDSKLNDSVDNVVNESENNNKSLQKKKRASNSIDQSSPSNDKENRNNLSLGSRNLIDDLEKKSPKVTDKLSNSTVIQDTSITKSKRNRTISWTTLSVSPAKETSFFSDSESAKKKVKSKLDSSKSALNTDILNKYSKKDTEDTLNSSKSKKRQAIKSNQENEQTMNKSADAQKSENNETVDVKESAEVLDISLEESTDTKKLFESSPILVESKVFIEDSDSNADVDQLIGDQCVPVVNHVFVSNSPNLEANEVQVDSTTMVKNNQSIEPMDIDETMPENVVLNDSDQLDSSIDSTSKNKSKSSILDKSTKELNASRRKSSISKFIGQDVNKSVSESKDQSSLTNIIGEDNNESKNSKRKSTSLSLTEKSITETNNDNITLNGSKRKSHSISITEEINKSTNGKRSNQKLSLSESISENNDDKSVNVSKRKSNSNSTSEVVEHEIVSSKDNNDEVDGSLGAHKQLNKSKRKSSSNSITENNTSIEQNKTVEKPKRKSSLTQSNLEDSIKSNNENKSTLLLSQINDGSHTPKTLKKNESLNVSNVEQKLNNQHLTTISTSTPLLDKTTGKAIKQHGVVNISDIITKEEKTNIINKSASKEISQNSSGNLEETEDDDDESSGAGSGLIIDEAEDAGDDYESGDSQDEDERQYEKENQIVERGETLTSDEDISNDSDYEKDSFIVTSDEEDNELLDGSGDDLSMSDNELSMSKKSKKKYDERKLAEQKRASREMYNSRHQINDYKKDVSKSKSKSKLDSLLLESDDDAEKSKTKKSKRLRLDSSHERSAINSDANETITMKKKKVKRLSESVLENADDEKEITVCADNSADIDPLVSNIKQEQKSARQSLNISTIPFNCVDDVENVQVDENATILNAEELQDPLADGDSESSENEEIMDNYDELLNNLNKKKIKATVDTSLNIDKKSNKSIREPIVDQLNLSVSKKSKKKKTELSKDSNLKENKPRPSLITSSIEKEQDVSSDSIDMKLLFAEDSNDSEDQQKTNDYGGEDFIPIKRTEAQTDIRNKEEAANKSLNTSIKKKKNNISFAEDNVSTDTNKQNMDVSLNTSVKGKKNKNQSLSEEVVPSKYKLEKLLNISLKTENDKTPLNKSLNTSLKKKKKSLSEDISEVDSNTSITASGKKKKHKKSVSEEITETPDLDNTKNNINKSLNKSVKNNNKSISEDANTGQLSTLITASAKKKKHNKSITDAAPPTLDDVEQPNESLNTSVKNKKSKKHSISEDITSTTDETESANIIVDVANDNDDDDDDMPEEIPYKSEKNNDVDTENHRTTEQTQTSGKKKRNRKKKNVNQQDIQSNDNAAPEVEEVSTEEKLSLPIEAVSDNAEASMGKKSKKRKRKLTAVSSTEDTIEEEGKENPAISEPLVTGNKKKKQKVSETVVPVPEDKPTEATTQKDNKNKKRKKREDDFETETEVAKVQKQNSADKGIPRLPTDIISQLTEKPKKDHISAKRAKIIATTQFEVKENRRTKGGNNEDIETVFLNGETSGKKKLFEKNKQKFVPFTPVLATSGFGFTTNFKVSVIPKETKFAAVAKPAEISNFKQDYLSKRLKKLTTDHMSRKPRSARLSKF